MRLYSYDFVCVHISQEFFRELNIRSAQKDSAVCAGTRISQLTDSEAPELRRRLLQLEQEWIHLANVLPTLHQKQQQVGNIDIFLSLPLFPILLLLTFLHLTEMSGYFFFTSC